MPGAGSKKQVGIAAVVRGFAVSILRIVFCSSWRLKKNMEKLYAKSEEKQPPEVRFWRCFGKLQQRQLWSTEAGSVSRRWSSTKGNLHSLWLTFSWTTTSWVCKQARRTGGLVSLNPLQHTKSWVFCYSGLWLCRSNAGLPWQTQYLEYQAYLLPWHEAILHTCCEV